MTLTITEDQKAPDQINRTGAFFREYQYSNFGNYLISFRELKPAFL